MTRHILRKGDHVQQIGGYEGIAWTGKEWVQYDCSGCALASGLIIAGQRLSGATYMRLWRKFFYNYHGPIIKHDRDLHAAWLAAGKALPFKK